MKKYLLIEINEPESAKDFNRNDVNTYRFDECELKKRLAKITEVYDRYCYIGDLSLGEFYKKAQRILLGED